MGFISLYCFSSLACPLSPLFLSQIICSNPLVTMMVVPVAVIQIIVEDWLCVCRDSLSCHLFLSVLYSVMAPLHL